MASIISLQTKDGSKRYRATVRVKRGTQLIHNETKTFRAKSLAVAWATQREFELKHSGRGSNATPSNSSEPCIIAQLIERCIYTSKSVSAAFTRACHLLGIKDLRFHDLRHEATCRLFESGYQIHEVAHFTGHRSWATLKRYTNLRAADIRLRH